MSSLSNRWSYGFAFGAVSSTVLLLFSEAYLPFPVPPWAKGTPARCPRRHGCEAEPAVTLSVSHYFQL